MARNTGRGSQLGQHNGRWTRAKSRGGYFDRKDPLMSSGRGELIGWILVGGFIIFVTLMAIL